MVRRNRLWRYAGEDPPTWFTATQSSDTQDKGTGEESESDNMPEQRSSASTELRQSTRQRKGVERLQVQECHILGQDTS